MAKEKSEKTAEAINAEGEEQASEALAEKQPAADEKERDIQQDVVESKLVHSKKKKKNAKEKPVWVEYKPQEIIEMIVDLANQGHSASEIGAILRDQHGVLDVRQATKKTILEVLTGAGIKQDVPEDLLSLVKRAVALDEHLKKNKKDASAKRGYELTVSKIRRLVKYYTRTSRLPKSWRYDIETAKLLVK